MSEAASRTDRGVHAKGQVVQILTAKEIVPKKLLRALNATLPSDIRVQEVEQTDSSFHVTLDCLAKTYVYHIDLGAGKNPFFSKFAWHYPYAIDFPKMQKAASALIGERDFSAFSTGKTADGMRHVYDIQLSFLESHVLRFVITGKSFLYKMARTIVGTLADLGSSKLDLSILPKLFTTGTRALCGATAPAHGLILQAVYYSKEKLCRDILAK